MRLFMEVGSAFLISFWFWSSQLFVKLATSKTAVEDSGEREHPLMDGEGWLGAVYITLNV
jgi:hypothetical protein